MRVVLVPLDDRPCTRIFPQRLAAIAGLDLTLPPRNLLGHFTRPGRPDELLSWLEDQIPGSDLLVLSVDMLCWGGLIASRTPEVSLETALARLDRLRCLRRRHPSLPVFCFNILTRLTITGSDASSLEWYPEVFRYCELLERMAKGDEEAIARCDQLRARIPREILGGFLQARQRNHKVNLAVIHAAAEGGIDFLALPQEDAGPEGIHRLEQAVLEREIHRLRVGDRVRIYPGADEAAMVLLARAVLSTGPGCPIQAHFYPPACADTIPPYEDRPFAASVKAQIEASGACLERLTPVHLVIYGGNPDCENPLSKPLREPWLVAGAIADHLEKGERVAVVDAAAPNGADPDFGRSLLDSRAMVSRLDAFAAWNTAGNSLGTAIAHAACLHYAAPGQDELRPLAHYRFLLERVLDDWAYQSAVRPSINLALRQAGHLPANLGSETPGVEAEVRQQLIPLAHDLFFSHFQGIRCREGVLSKLESLEICLPWPRTFEVEISAQIQVEEE